MNALQEWYEYVNRVSRPVRAATAAPPFPPAPAREAAEQAGVLPRPPAGEPAADPRARARRYLASLAPDAAQAADLPPLQPAALDLSVPDLAFVPPPAPVPRLDQYLEERPADPVPWDGCPAAWVHEVARRAADTGWLAPPEVPLGPGAGEAPLMEASPEPPAPAPAAPAPAADPMPRPAPPTAALPLSTKSVERGPGGEASPPPLPPLAADSAPAPITCTGLSVTDVSPAAAVEDGALYAPDEAAATALPPALFRVVPRLPKHWQLLLETPEEGVTQNSYKLPFKESRQDLVRRLLDPPLTLEEVARLLGVCPTTVRRYTNRGCLRHFRTPGNQRRFRLSDVLEFMETRAAEIEQDAAADAAAAADEAERTSGLTPASQRTACPPGSHTGV
jgi:excisionase family DNA binding protein